MQTRLLTFSIIVITFASCDVIIEEPVPVYHDLRDHFTGNFEVEEFSETLHSYTYYNIDVIKGSRHDNVVYLRNFYGEGISVFAEVEGDYLYIPHQVVAGFHIEGEGFLDGHRLELSYSVLDERPYHSFTDYCNAIAWR